MYLCTPVFVENKQKSVFKGIKVSTARFLRCFVNKGGLSVQIYTERDVV